MKRLLILCLAAELLCACASAQKKVPPTVPATDKNKIEVRNNAASLLADLLGNEKNVSKLLIVKRNSAELGRLIKAISTTAGDGSKQLEALAKSDATLDLHALDLPPGETAARAADAKTKEKDLLLSSGATFEFNLLLTQTEALSYGSHLAKVAAESSPSPEQAREFHSLDVALDALFQRVVARMRVMPRK